MKARELKDVLCDLDAAGWQLVPREPTEAMIAAFWCAKRIEATPVTDLWEAMLDAAKAGVTNDRRI